MSAHTVIKPIEECHNVADLLATPDRWIKGLAAVDSDGRTVDVHHPRACRFCLWGAIARVYSAKRDDRDRAYAVANRFQTELSIENEIHWNDAEARTHEEVLAAVVALGI